MLSYQHLTFGKYRSHIKREWRMACMLKGGPNLPKPSFKRPRVIVGYMGKSAQEAKRLRELAEASK